MWMRQDCPGRGCQTEVTSERRKNLMKENKMSYIQMFGKEKVRNNREAKQQRAQKVKREDRKSSRQNLMAMYLKGKF